MTKGEREREIERKSVWEKRRQSKRNKSNKNHLFSSLSPVYTIILTSEFPFCMCDSCRKEIYIM